MKKHRILIADDEPSILDLYRQILAPRENHRHDEELAQLEQQLFQKASNTTLEAVEYELTLCAQGEEAVTAVQQSIAEENPYAVAFIDVRMPPGIDGVEAAEAIRKLDTEIQIVIVTAYSDIDVQTIIRRVPPRERLLFVVKPFHAQEIAQFTTSLTAKWDAQRKHIDLRNRLESQVNLQQRSLREIGQELADTRQHADSVEKALATSEQYFRTLFEHSGAGIVLYRMEGETLGERISVNPVMSGMLGRGSSDVPQDIFPENVMNYIARTVPSLLNGEWLKIDCELWRINGNPIPVEIEAGVIPTGGDRLLILFVRDVSERRRQEAQIELLLQTIDQSPTAVLIVTTEGKITYNNITASQLLTEGKKIPSGAKITELINTSCLMKLEETPGAAKECQSEEIHIQREGHPAMWLQLSISELELIPGAQRRYLITVQDTTSTHNLREQVIHSQKMEALGRLAAGVAHDFNNILTIINGSCELLRLDIQKPEQIVLLEEIIHASSMAKHLTSQLLLFSHRQQSVNEPMSLQEVIAEIGKLLKRVIGADVKIVTQLDPEAGIIDADREQVKQILLNLAVNSRDAMPLGGEIHISIENAEVDEILAQTMPGARTGRFVRLSFFDNGSGIPKDVQKQIFEPFFTTKGQGKGTGLGLSTVYGIVRNHGGWIDLNSEEGHGTTFHIYFPVLDEDNKTPHNPEEIPIEQLQGEGKTILLVEDNEAVRHFAAEVLKTNGYQVIEAGSAQEARLHLREADGFLSDVVLPDSTGIQVAHELLAVRPDVPVMLMSGYTADDERNNLIRMLGIPFLQKPFNFRDLLKFVKDAQPMNIDAEAPCDLYETCGFFRHVEKLGMPLQRGWMHMFCGSLAKSERCARKRYYLRTGQCPDDTLSPTGRDFKEFLESPMPENDNS